MFIFKQQDIFELEFFCVCAFYLNRAGTLDRIRRTEKIKNQRTELLTGRPNL